MAHQWYILHVHAGRDVKVKEKILEAAAKRNATHLFGPIEVPSYKSTINQRGKERENEKSLFTGYVLIKMELCDLSKSVINSIPKVRFLGGNHNPSPISEAEAFNAIHADISAAAKAINPDDQLYMLGQKVRVIKGPFENFSGEITEIDKEKKQLRIGLLVFGRSTPVDIPFEHVEKQDY